ncbi:MAG: hypothetical protein AAF539_10800 [Planctomycetota bacterium]
MKVATRWGLIWIALGSAIFTAGLLVFCYALGLDFSSEGWSESSPSLEAMVTMPSFIGSVIAMTASIIVFFIGVQKVNR